MSETPGTGKTEKENNSEKEKMLRGELYLATDPQLTAENLHAQRLLVRYNTCQPEERTGILHALLGTCGEGVVIKPGFGCDYGYNIHLERNVFLSST